ncbi:Protein translocase subunit SecY [Candidatus Gugararchaeum adminiculabundum]|nr:Protein translocase subunit SecY [Candidatus Gugararchaeum adminiculabundum]
MKLDALRPIVSLLPEVKAPKQAPSIMQKLQWTTIALIIFFVMYHIFPIGVVQKVGGEFEFLQVITASRIGSLITTGIGPIILASIFLQLFKGAKIIDIDLHDPEGKALFQGTQKLLAILLCFFEAGIYIMTGSILTYGMEGSGFNPLLGSFTFTQILVITQIALGSIILMYLDEVVSKYGIGSGISLFIAAGVSLSVVLGTVQLIVGQGGVISMLTGSGAGASALSDALIVMLPVFFTAVVFLIVVYAEGIKVEIPLALGTARGFGARYPIKFMYVSNIPVILASALTLNIQIMARALAGKVFMLGNTNIVPLIGMVRTDGYLTDGFLYFVTPIRANLLTMRSLTAYFGYLGTPTPVTGLPEWFHLLTYTVSLVILCVIFGKFWIETTGMGSKDVAEQLQQQGLQIPGYRRDPRVIEGVLDRYIPTITILGSIFVGLLAAFADIAGALGTGTGILLTVGILRKMYEDLEAQQMFDLHPGLKNIVGGD